MYSANLNSFIGADSEKCIGCRTCELVCAIAHSENKPKTAGAIEGAVIPRIFVVATPEHIAPVVCRHCEDAPCAAICTMQAISRVDGKVLVDTNRCVGCRLCLMACPFGATEFVPQDAGTQPIYQAASDRDAGAGRTLFRANKCDLCNGISGGPACVPACPTGALSVVSPAKEAAKRKLEAAHQIAEGMKEW